MGEPPQTGKDRDGKDHPQMHKLGLKNPVLLPHPARCQVPHPLLHICPIKQSPSTLQFPTSRFPHLLCATRLKAGDLLRHR